MRTADGKVTIELNPREQRLYDRLRAQVLKPSPGTAPGVRDLLLLLPDLTVCLVRLLSDGRVPLGSKALAVAGLGYVVSPIDFIPALLFGPLGLLDDLVIVSATLSRILNCVHPDVVRSQWSGKGDVLEAIQSVTSWSESLFTVRLRGMINGLLGGK